MSIKMSISLTSCDASDLLVWRSQAPVATYYVNAVIRKDGFNNVENSTTHTQLNVELRVVGCFEMTLGGAHQ
jgi:hypothetical protein